MNKKSRWGALASSLVVSLYIAGCASTGKTPEGATAEAAAGAQVEQDLSEGFASRQRSISLAQAAARKLKDADLDKATQHYENASAAGNSLADTYVRLAESKAYDKKSEAAIRAAIRKQAEIMLNEEQELRTLVYPDQAGSSVQTVGVVLEILDKLVTSVFKWIDGKKSEQLERVQRTAERYMWPTWNEAVGG